MATEVDLPDTPVTRLEIQEAITHLAAASARYPAHFVERKRVAHAAIDALLDQLDTTI